MRPAPEIFRECDIRGIFGRALGVDWALVRASNTQPALVLRAEGTTPRALAHATGVVDTALRAYPDVAAVRWDA